MENQYLCLQFLAMAQARSRAGQEPESCLLNWKYPMLPLLRPKHSMQTQSRGHCSHMLDEVPFGIGEGLACKFCPTPGKSARTLTSWCLKVSPLPMPLSCSKWGVWTAPAHMMTSPPTFSSAARTHNPSGESYSASLHLIAQYCEHSTW